MLSSEFIINNLSHTRCGYFITEFKFCSQLTYMLLGMRERKMDFYNARGDHLITSLYVEGLKPDVSNFF